MSAPVSGRRRRASGGAAVNRAHRIATTIFSVGFVCIGFALLVVTAVHGGGVFGFVLGALFVAAGSARLYLLRQSR
jgi:hypothetical protein